MLFQFSNLTPCCRVVLNTSCSLWSETFSLQKQKQKIGNFYTASSKEVNKSCSRPRCKRGIEGINDMFCAKIELMHKSDHLWNANSASYYFHILWQGQLNTSSPQHQLHCIMCCVRIKLIHRPDHLWNANSASYYFHFSDEVYDLITLTPIRF